MSACAPGWRFSERKLRRLNIRQSYVHGLSSGLHNIGLLLLSIYMVMSW